MCDLHHLFCRSTGFGFGSASQGAGISQGNKQESKLVSYSSGCKMNMHLSFSVLLFLVSLSSKGCE